MCGQSMKVTLCVCFSTSDNLHSILNKVSEFTSRWVQLHLNQPCNVMCLTCIFLAELAFVCKLLSNPAKKAKACIFCCVQALN